MRGMQTDRIPQLGGTTVGYLATNRASSLGRYGKTCITTISGHSISSQRTVPTQAGIERLGLGLEITSVLHGQPAGDG